MLRHGMAEQETLQMERKMTRWRIASGVMIRPMCPIGLSKCQACHLLYGDCMYYGGSLSWEHQSFLDLCVGCGRYSDYGSAAPVPGTRFCRMLCGSRMSRSGYWFFSLARRESGRTFRDGGKVTDGSVKRTPFMGMHEGKKSV